MDHIWNCVAVYNLYMIYTKPHVFLDSETITLKRVPSLHTFTFTFLASLALNDLLLVLLGVGLDYIPDFLMNPSRKGDIFFVKIVCFFNLVCFNSSLFFITLVSIERYLCNMSPYETPPS